MSLVEALAQTAERWSDPDALPRHDAVHGTLHADNRFTAEATAFALNQLMLLLSLDDLAAFRDDVALGPGQKRPTVVVEHGAESPVDGLREVVAAILVGARVWSLLPPESTAIVPAFYETLREIVEEIDGTSVDIACARTVNELDKGAAAVGEDAAPVVCISTGSCESVLKPWCEDHAFRWIDASVGCSVGIIDGSEPDEVRHNLAEDTLLHEGAPQRSLRILWAPNELTPDPVLQAMADFRGVFPAHDSTPGSLEMRRAFLEAADQSHAYAAGMQFLVSRGDPEPQDGAHLRWSEYDDLEDVAAWVTEHAEEIYAIAVRPSLADRLPEALQAEALHEHGIQCIEPGHVHRRPLLTPRVRVLLDVLLD